MSGIFKRTLICAVVTVLVPVSAFAVPKDNIEDSAPPLVEQFTASCDRYALPYGLESRVNCNVSFVVKVANRYRHMESMPILLQLRPLHNESYAPAGSPERGEYEAVRLRVLRTRVHQAALPFKDICEAMDAWAVRQESRQNPGKAAYVKRGASMSAPEGLRYTKSSEDGGYTEKRTYTFYMRGKEVGRCYLEIFTHFGGNVRQTAQVGIFRAEGLRYVSPWGVPEADIKRSALLPAVKEKHMLDVCIAVAKGINSENNLRAVQDIVETWAGAGGYSPGPEKSPTATQIKRNGDNIFQH